MKSWTPFVVTMLFSARCSPLFIRSCHAFQSANGFRFISRSFRLASSTNGEDDDLMRSALRRARSKLDDSEDNSNSGASSVLNSVLGRARASLDARRAYSSNDSADAVETSKNILESVSDSISSNKRSRQATGTLPPRKDGIYSTKKGFNANPAITNTALAHTLWESVLIPNVDTAIDATCGNGYDSVAMAKMLFHERDEDEMQASLLCIDIQQQACDATRNALSQELGDRPNLLRNNIQVLNTPHAPLPRPNDSSSVGLVAYNLGFLPRSDKSAMTQMDTTIQSIADALLMVRIGGMVSVVTYPRTNPKEDVAVKLFLECMALLSSNIQTWQEFMESQEDLPDDVRTTVTHFAKYVQQQGDPNSAWRVSLHLRLGADQPPTLITATRIK